MRIIKRKRFIFDDNDLPIIHFPYERYREILDEDLEKLSEKLSPQEIDKLKKIAEELEKHSYSPFRLETEVYLTKNDWDNKISRKVVLIVKGDIFYSWIHDILKRYFGKNYPIEYYSFVVTKLERDGYWVHS